jgi:HD-GYP domain-containing protein (c-di-GMP phosphodiesterase class II)
MGLKDTVVIALRRAALLHNLGRLAIGNGILDKAGPLNPAEWERMRLYTYHTERVLVRPAILRHLARLAGSVQERLDGSGFHRGLPAAMLSTSARLFAAADVYQALTEERPHRPALAPEAAARELSAEVQAGRLTAKPPTASWRRPATRGHARLEAGPPGSPTVRSKCSDEWRRRSRTKRSRGARDLGRLSR